LAANTSHFRPEFLNRVDDLILFHALGRQQLRQIVAIQLQRIQRLLAEQKLKIELSESALDYIAEVGYDPVYGARPLKRAIQKELENPIATKILENAFPTGSIIHAERADGSLQFSCTPPADPALAPEASAQIQSPVS